MDTGQPITLILHANPPPKEVPPPEPKRFNWRALLCYFMGLGVGGYAMYRIMESRGQRGLQ